MTLSVINLALDEDEARFVLGLQALGSAVLAGDEDSIVEKHTQLIKAFLRLSPERANALVVRQIKLMRVAFPGFKINAQPALGGSTFPGLNT